MRSDKEVSEILLSHFRVEAEVYQDRGSYLPKHAHEILSKIIRLYDLDPYQAVRIFEELGKQGTVSVGHGFVLAYIPGLEKYIEYPYPNPRIE